MEEEIKEKPKQEEKAEEVKKAEALKENSVEKKNEKMEEDKKKTKKKVEEKKPKEKAIVRGESLRISTKFSVAICKMISKKSPDKAIELLEGVVKERMPVRMASSEVAHQKSRGMKNIAGAKFPKKAAIAIGELIKQLKANAVINGIENPVIVIAQANQATRPFRSGGRKAKRTHVYIEVRAKTKLNKEENKSEKKIGDKK